MKVYFITRFSIFDPKAPAWKIAHLPAEEYKKKLFSTDRLDTKFDVFEKMTLPSIVGQTNKNFEWFIIASTFLPNVYKERLNSLVAPYTQIKVHYITNYCELSRTVKSHTIEDSYATVRLDDDDGLSSNYVELLQKYKDKKECIITFPYGREFKIEENKIIMKDNEHYYPLIALGLCAINMNILSCGQHTMLQQKYKIVTDNTKNMYYLFCSPYCDSKRKF